RAAIPHERRCPCRGSDDWTLRATTLILRFSGTTTISRSRRPGARCREALIPRGGGAVGPAASKACASAVAPAHRVHRTVREQSAARYPNVGPFFALVALL